MKENLEYRRTDDCIHCDVLRMGEPETHCRGCRNYQKVSNKEVVVFS